MEIYLIIPAIMLLSVAYLVFLIRRERKLFKTALSLTATVKVVSKEFETVKKGASKHYIAFEFPDRTRKSFQVDIKNYNTILEGDTGLLYYKEQGDRVWFVEFQRQT